MKLKGGKRHKHGTYKEDSRTRVRTKTTSGLQKLGQKRTDLVVVRNQKDLKGLPR